MASFLLYLLVGTTLIGTGLAMKCHMCADMGYFGICTENSQFHAMECGDDSTFCLRTEGTFIISNNQSTPGVNRTMQGVRRECASKPIMQMYNQIWAAPGCIDTKVFRNMPFVNNDGTFPQLNFTGSQCGCNTESCNGASGRTFSFGAVILVFSMVFYNVL